MLEYEGVARAESMTGFQCCGPRQESILSGDDNAGGRQTRRGAVRRMFLFEGGMGSKFD